MGYKQIVFDVDGTLIDTEYAVIHSLQDTIRAINGKIISDKELTFALGITGENALQRLGVSDIASALFMWDKNMEKYRDTITVFHGIKELLETISELKLGIGIVTSKTHEEFRSDFQKFDISSYFETVVCADDTLQHKPEPDPLLKYMEWTKCQANELLYIGDSIGYEGLVEYMIFHLLKKSSLAENEFVCYDLEEIKYGTVIYNGVKSPDFLAKVGRLLL